MSAVSVHGHTALDLAMQGGHTGVIELLMRESKKRGDDVEGRGGSQVSGEWRAKMEQGARAPFARRGRVLGKVGQGSLEGSVRVCDGRKGVEEVREEEEGEANSGGWRRGCEQELEIEEGMCDFESVHVEDDDFNTTLLRHLESERPLRIRGVFQRLEAHEMHSTRAAWSRDALLNASGGNFEKVSHRHRAETPASMYGFVDSADLREFHISYYMYTFHVIYCIYAFELQPTMANLKSFAKSTGASKPSRSPWRNI